MSPPVRPLEWVVVRRSAAPPAFLSWLRPPGLDASLDRFQSHLDQLDASLARAIERLGALVGQEEPGSGRARLVALRRALHNRRLQEASALASRLESSLPELEDALARLTSLPAQRLAQEQVLERLHQEQQERLAQALRHQGFADALWVASPSLARRLEEAQGSVASTKLRLRALQYLARFATKTSPFGLFVEVYASRLGDARREPEGEALLWLHRPEAQRLTTWLRENPTLTVQGERAWLVDRSGAKERLRGLDVVGLRKAGWGGFLGEEAIHLFLEAGVLERPAPPRPPPSLMPRETLLRVFREATQTPGYVDWVHPSPGVFPRAIALRTGEALHPLCAQLACRDALWRERAHAVQLVRSLKRTEPIPLLELYARFSRSPAPEVPPPPWSLNLQQEGDSLLVVAEAPARSKGEGRSFSASVMPLSSPERLVVNGVHEGHGRMASRFAALLPAAYREAVRQGNRHPGVRLAALQDGSRLAINDHPPLTDWALLLPGGLSSLLPERHVLPSSLQVEELDGSLVLRDPEGQRVAPLDLGLQSWGRGPFFDFLLLFSPARDISLSVLFSWIDARHPPRELTPGVLQFPPVHLQHLLLRRRTWRIELGSLPRPTGTVASRLLTLDQWRRRLLLPAEAFLTLCPPSQPSAPGANPDDHKPLYFRWDCPLFIELFEQVIRRARGPFWVSECAPAPDAPLPPEEWILQWVGP